ncbi:single-stranded DNA-binding protein [Magnetococcales bacterium HHB-1]
MAYSRNKVELLGNLGRYPELRYTQGGTAVANFSVATSDQWTDKHSGEKKSDVEWHRVVIFGKLAEVAKEYLKKGNRVSLEGKLKSRQYTDGEGVKRQITEVVLAPYSGDMIMLTPRGNGRSNQNGNDYQHNNGWGEAPYSQQGYQQMPECPPAQQDYQQISEQLPPTQQDFQQAPEFESDIPF